MRYKCYRCEKWIKDKFIFGLLHLCLSDEEYQYKLKLKEDLLQQLNLGPYKQGIDKNS